MSNLRRLALAVALALGACVSAAAGAEMLLGDPGTLLSSAPPGLLGPITELGRVGWKCAPERAATARSADDAGLPKD